MKNTEILDTVLRIVAEETNHDVRELSAETNFDEDMALQLAEEDTVLFQKIIGRINNNFDVQFDPQLFLQSEPENQTIGYLVQLLEDEIEL